MNEEIKENKKIKQSGKYIFKKHNLNFYPNNNILNNYTNANKNLCTKYIKTNISEKTLKHTYTNSNSYFNNINKNLKIDITHNNNIKYKNNTNGNLLCYNNSKNYENKFLIKRNTNIPFNKMNLNNIKKKRLKTISISMKIDKSKSFIKNIKNNENINEMKKSLNLFNIKDKKRDLTPSLLKRINAKKNNTININNINMNNINTNNFNHNYNRHMSGDFVNIFRITEECKQQKNNDKRNILDNIPCLSNINKLNLPMICYRNKIKNNNNNNKDEEYFEYKKESIIELTKEEKEIYGNRCMKGYIKKKLLGKGGKK